MKVDEIRNEREFYEAVRDYSSKVWQWGATVDDDCDSEPMPDELLELLFDELPETPGQERRSEEDRDGACNPP